MGFLFAVLTRLLHGLLKLAGLTPQTLETEPGTIMNIWVPKHTIIKADGKTLYIPPKKPVVLLVHCFAMDGIFLWFPQVLALTRNYSVYVPDLLFFGGSTTDKTERSTTFQAEFLAKGMEILEVNKVTLVGLSYGGIIGFEMAKLYPQLVKSLVVTGSVVELTESISHESLQQLGLSSWSDLLLPQTIEGFRRMLNVGAHKLPWLPNFVFHGIFETMFNNRKERSELLAAMVIPDKDATYTKYRMCCRQQHLWWVLLSSETHKYRIHLLCGEEDKIFSLELVKNMKRRLGGRTTLECMKNGGHLLSMEKPIDYNRSLKRFLAEVNKGGDEDDSHTD